MIKIFIIQSIILYLVIIIISTVLGYYLRPYIQNLFNSKNYIDTHANFVASIYIAVMISYFIIGLILGTLTQILLF